MHVRQTSRLSMIITALIINIPTSPHISLKSYLAPMISQEESSSSDDESNTKSETSSKVNLTENHTNTWHYHLAKALVSMHHDMHVIITGFDEISHSDTKDDIEYKKTQYELMRIALLLNPSELSTCSVDESMNPYEDMKAFDDQSFENQPYRYEQLRFKLLGSVSKLKRGMGRLRLVLFSSSYQNKSPDYIRNYRKRIASSLSDIREHLIEYNRVNESVVDDDKSPHHGDDDDDELTKHRKSVHDVMTEMTTENLSLVENRIADYRIKLKLNKSKEKHEFISSPVTSWHSGSDEKFVITENTNEDIGCAFKPLEFPDLYHEANKFFDSETTTEVNHQTTSKK